MSNTLVTSASGQIGTPLIPLLLKSSSIKNIVLPTTKVSRLTSQVPQANRIIIFDGSIQNPAWVEENFTKHQIDTVFLNLTGVDEVFTTLQLPLLHHPLWLSEAFNLPLGLTPGHVLVKTAIERMLQQSKVFREGGRTFTILGPTLFFTNDLRGKETMMGPMGIYGEPIGTMGVSRVDVEDIALAVLKVAESPEIGNGKNIMIGRKELYTSYTIPSHPNNNDMTTDEDEQALQNEIARLESQLAAAHAKLGSPPDAKSQSNSTVPQTLPIITTTSPSSHALLLLSDSALPLGSFAFSSGLESYLAHHPSRTPPFIQPFLSLALQTLATTTLPYLLAAYRDPSRLQDLADTLDACILCHVTRRASTAQGRALLTVWERAFSGTVDAGSECRKVLAELSAELKKTSLRSSLDSGENAGTRALGHFAPIWAVVTRAMDIPIHDSANVFLLNHAKAVLSAAVRASVVGPYQAQAVLGSDWLRGEIERLLRENWEVKIEEAGQGVPAMDLWVGRHEMLYSRIFNS
ncbi:MAG: hypothetical protein Q9166_001245 [cf. Caloplaca sp. 2 TL-2023]